MATDFNQAMENARHDVRMITIVHPDDRRTKTLMLYLDAMAAAHAEVVAERDSYRDVAHKLARYVLPDSDTLTIRQLVEAADGVCNAADEGDDEEPGKKSDDEICEDYERATGCPAYGDHGPDNAGWQR